MWQLLARTGLRRGELVGLTWDDVNLEEATLRVSRSVTEVRGEQHVTGGKSHDARRTLSLGSGMVEALRSHHARQAEERLQAGPAWHDDNDRVFRRPDGRGVRPRWVTDRFRTLVDELGLPRIGGPHGLRHTAATIMLREGVPVQIVSGRLGHASPDITLRVYTHVTPSDDEVAAEAMDRLLAVYDRDRD